MSSESSEKNKKQETGGKNISVWAHADAMCGRIACDASDDGVWMCV